MKEWMPGQTGWTDRGPRVESTLDGEVGRLPAVWSDDPAVIEVERQGRTNPRRLTLEESRVAEKNRKSYHEEREEFETWYRTQIKTQPKKRR